MVSKNSLKVYNSTIKEVPAYSKFLKKNGFEPKQISSVEEFKKLPFTSKSTYLKQFPLKDLLHDQDWWSQIIYCSTSGSTGTPHYFPRNNELATRASYMAEEYLLNSSYGKGRTLLIMGFGMGVWIGGIFTMQAFEIAAERSKIPVAILPTGYNFEEVFKALRRLSPEYDQTIIAGYPPFIKEIIDEAPDQEVDLKKLNLRFVFAAEAFSEIFRDYICEKAGVKNEYMDTMNIYGSADMGAMAHETPLSILVRRIAMANPVIFDGIFGQIEKTPTLAQYNPEFIDFEEVDGELILTSDSAVPLVRYAIGDHGGVISFEELKRTLGAQGIDLAMEAKKHKVELIDRPFVFVYERTDFSTNLHGVNIYPEFVKYGLSNKSVADKLTGRFTMLTKYDENHEQYLHINVELRKRVSGDNELGTLVLDAVYRGLVAKSSEFAEIARNREADGLIEITLWENGHKKYFSPGTKQKWVEKAG